MLLLSKTAVLHYLASQRRWHERFIPGGCSVRCPKLESLYSSREYQSRKKLVTVLIQFDTLMRQGKPPKATNGFDMLGLFRNLTNNLHGTDVLRAASGAAVNTLSSTCYFLIRSKYKFARPLVGIVGCAIPSPLVDGLFTVSPINHRRATTLHGKFRGHEAHVCFAPYGYGSHHPFRCWSGQGATHGKNSHNYRGS